ENFLAFPVGTPVPVGVYDRDHGVWDASDNGRVVKDISVDGGTAQLDVAGNGQAADSATLAGLGITDSERQRLAQLYQPGQSLWRFATTHFTMDDLNWPILLTDAKVPNVEAQDPKKKGPDRSEEHTSELQSLAYLVCRLLLEKK